MLKSLILLFNVAGLLFYSLFFQQTVTVTQDLPERAIAGSEFPVKITINKGAIKGFAKLQQEFPEGFSVKENNSAGASFTFEGGKAKLIWMALPPEETIEVTFTVSTAAGFSGTAAIGGTFAFLEENQKRTIDIPSKSITIDPAGGTPVATATDTIAGQDTTAATGTGDATAGSGTPGTENTDTGSGTGTTADATGSQADNTGTTATTGTTTGGTDDPASGATTAGGQGNDGISVSREVDMSTLASAREITVNVIIRKGNLTGFAKLLDRLPAGFTAIEKSSSQGVFSFSEQSSKFLWMNLPAQDEVRVSYVIKVPADASGSYYINGDFSYLVNEETRKYEVPRSTLIIPAASTATGAGTGTGTGAGVPAPETGVKYKVQIAALKKPVAAEVLKKKHNFNETVQTEAHEGWSKYTVGGFAEYREARDRRETVRSAHNVVGPFVTAYNNGARITVQEALMISSQKWVR